MKKGQKIVATKDWMKLKKGTEFTFIKEFFYNGETWMRLKTEQGAIVEFPSVFFWE